MRSKSARTSSSAVSAGLAAVLAFAGCAATARPADPPGASPPVDPSASASGQPAGPLTPWQRAPAKSSLVPVGPTTAFVSRGHGRDRFSAILTASDRAAFIGPEPRPAGFVVCAVHEDQADRAAQLVLCMRKESARAGDWSYGVADAHDAAFRRVGKLADCSACHAVGPREGLFEPETSPPPAPR